MSERPSEPPPYWTQSAPAARWQERNGTALRRFLGGSPLAVLVKLLLVSFVVGAMLMWLRITPEDVFSELSALLARLSYLGFQSLHDFGSYIFAGAVIVIPVWLVIRLLSYRGR